MGQTYSKSVTIIYGGIYTLAVLATIIKSTIETRAYSKAYHSSQNINNPSDTTTKDAQPNDTHPANEHEEKKTTDVLTSIQMELEDDSTPHKLQCMSLMKYFFKTMWKTKKIYWALIPHIFDQATDIGVTIEYYNAYHNGTTSIHFFILSIIFIALQRILSSIGISKLTKSPSAAVLQLFDLALLRALWVNHVLGLTEPCVAQRYIEFLEAIFESSPELLLALGFIFKTLDKQPLSPVVVLSVLSSFWTLTSKVAS
eukprot:747431_1